MKIQILLASALLCSTATLSAQNNTMSHFPTNYGENYKSVAFDGARTSEFTNTALFFKGKKSQTFTAWGDTWGDIVVGVIDNNTSKVTTNVLINDKLIKVDNTPIALSISEKGKLTAYVGNAFKNGVIEIFEAAIPESIAKWNKSKLALNIEIKQINPITNKSGETTLLITDNSGKLYSTTKRGGKWSAIAQLECPSIATLKVAAAKDGSAKMIINDALYSYADGNITACSCVEGKVLDVAINDQNQAKIVYANNKGKYYLKSGADKAVALPIKGNLCEVAVDAESENTLYYTMLRDSITEIYKSTKDGWKWKTEAITDLTPYNNRLLASVQGAPASEPIQICWLQETREDVKVNALSAIKVDIAQTQITDTCDKEQIKELMAKVADWQLTFSFTDKTKRDWHWGAFYEGLIAAYEVTGDERYFEELMNVGEYFNWELEPDVLHADRLLVCDIYRYLYEKTGRQHPEMMNATRWAMDLHTSRKAKVETKYKGGNYKYEWWTWCDALYMAAPSFYTYSKLTGDPAAMNFAYNQWKVIASNLYSEEDRLFFRDDRYFTTKSTNGGKLFWARGNGWISGAIPRILETLPAGHPHRAYFEKQFREIMSKLLEIQQPEGMWTVNLLDPEELLIGESSGTGFFGFAFAWGVNNGILDKDVYGPAAKKAWKALSANVSEFGRLGYVQQVAGAPYPFFEHQAHTYASGAFLMFANEILKMEE